MAEISTAAVAPKPLASRRDRVLAHLAMLSFAALIAGSFTTGALAVPYIHPIPLNALRFLLAALLMGAAAFGMARQPFAFPRAPWRFAIMGVLMAVYFVTMFIALTMTQPVATSAVYTLVPLMTAVSAWVMLHRSGGWAAMVEATEAAVGPPAGLGSRRGA